MIVNSGPDDLVISAAITGTPASWLRPSLVANGLEPDNLAPLIDQKNYTAGDDALRRWKDIWAAGQGLQAIDAIEPVAVIVNRIEQEYRQAMRRAATRVDMLGDAAAAYAEQH
jgi:nitronate monooxygenase